MLEYFIVTFLICQSFAQVPKNMPGNILIAEKIYKLISNDLATTQDFVFIAYYDECEGKDSLNYTRVAAFSRDVTCTEGLFQKGCTTRCRGRAYQI